MKLALKILKLFAILIITVSVILFSASFLLQEKVAGIVLKSLNKNISTKLDVGAFRLSFLRKFPKASLELRNVLVHSSPGFNSASFGGMNTDTLLAARFVSMEFSIIDVLKGNYNIERIGVRAGRMNFFTDLSGQVNYNIPIKNAKPDVNDFTINLERINLNDIETNYHNLATRFIINGQIKTGRLKSRISGKNIDFIAGIEIQIDSIQLYDIKIRKTIKADLDLNLQNSKNGLLFRKSILSVEDYDFELKGSVSADKLVDLNITGHNFDISDIRNYLPEKYLKLVSGYDPSGRLIINCKIKGPLTPTSSPHIEVNCILNKGQISYGPSALSINNISFSGNFSNGSKNRPETTSLSIRDFKAKLGSAEYTGSFMLYGFDHPKIAFHLKGRVFPGELKEFFGLQKISAAGGFFDLDFKIDNKPYQNKIHNFSDIIDLKPEVQLAFNSFSIGLQNNKILFDQVNGNLLVSKSIRARNFQFNYKGQQIKVNGLFGNLPEWLEGRPVQMTASADVSFSRFIPEVFLKNLPDSDSSPKNKTAFMLPDDIVLDINFSIDSLNYKTFSSSKISGRLNYKPRLLIFKSVNMESLNGVISGNGFIVQNSSKSLIGKGSFSVNNIDVKKTFITFHNFGQDFIKAENLEGALSGSFSLLIPMDSLLKIQVKSVTAEGKFLLVKGALINFDPVKHLSSFIELSELETIRFEQMENDFFIRNNSLYIPQMDIKSSAVNLSMNGKHSFNNDYDYHVKMLLSEVLSKKRKKVRSNESPFGTIEDDGLGRTSLLLKIEGRGEDIKVGYDMKAAGNELRNNIKSERQMIKNILNQEYGWFKSDSTKKQQPVEKKSRFRITWDDTDNVKTTPDPPVENKESPIKNLFKRDNNK